LLLASARLTLLVCDDGKNIRTVLTVCLPQRSHQAMSAPSAKGARIALAEQPFDLASVRCTD
jgi:DNA-binding NtrC family response regulator